MNTEICKYCSFPHGYFLVEKISDNIMKMESIYAKRLKENIPFNDIKCIVFVNDITFVENFVKDFPYNIPISFEIVEKNQPIFHVTDNCPYYMEHEIDDWSNNEL